MVAEEKHKMKTKPNVYQTDCLTCKKGMVVDVDNPKLLCTECESKDPIFNKNKAPNNETKIIRGKKAYLRNGSITT